MNGVEYLRGIKRSFLGWEPDKPRILVPGCFDLFHAGHADLLRTARGFNGLVIVALPTDDVIRQLKGPERPIIGFWDRAEVLRACEYVDKIVRQDDLDPTRVADAVGASVIVKGAEWAGRDVPEAQGRTLVFVRDSRDSRVSKIIEKIKGVDHGNSITSHAGGGEHRCHRNGDCSAAVATTP